MIHSTAIVHSAAELAENVDIGPYAIIDRDVRIENGTKVGSHAHINGRTHIGEGCRIFPYAVIGEEPQDLKYGGEPSELVIGNLNVFREFVTVHRGTEKGIGRTVIGSHNLFMAYSHVAHDCVIGDYVVMANAATLAGHIEIRNHAIIGGLVAIHQYVRIGAFALVGGFTGVAQDVPPYMLVSGARGRLQGLNTVGLRRHGFSSKTIQGLRRAYRILFRSDLPLGRSLEQVREQITAFPELEELVRFIETSKRGICR